MKMVNMFKSTTKECFKNSFCSINPKSEVFLHRYFQTFVRCVSNICRKIYLIKVLFHSFLREEKLSVYVVVVHHSGEMRRYDDCSKSKCGPDRSLIQCLLSALYILEYAAYTASFRIFSGYFTVKTFMAGLNAKLLT